MKLVTWNVNGIRACVRKGFLDYFNEIDAEVFCIQETKLVAGQIELELEGYHQYWNYAERKGYSGTAIFTKRKPLSVQYGLGLSDEEPEGRVISLEFEDYYVVTVYSPNSQRDLARLSFRLDWERELLKHLNMLESMKPVILCGDLNVAHAPIDLRNPKSNLGNSGFTEEERGRFGTLLDEGFIDAFRHLYPDEEGAYTWWSYMSKVRERNIGWRIDYFVLSEKLKDRLIDCQIHCQVMGSDHCPVVLDLDMD